MNNGKDSKNVLRKVIALAFVLQAILLVVRGNLDVLSGKPVLNVLQEMITQGIELIIKAQGVQEKLKKSDSEALLRLRSMVR